MVYHSRAMNTQRWDATDYASNARFVADLAGPVVELLGPKPGERILDLGCGDGALTERLASLGTSIVGVDASVEMVEAARARGLDARLVDACALAFQHEFDAVFSNAVLHWVPDLAPVLEGVRRALKPGGRFVGECGGHGCVAAVCTALAAVAARRGLRTELPWTFRTAEDLEESLQSAGFEPATVQIVPRPTFLPSGMAAWLRTFAGWMFDGLPAEEREAAFADVVDLLRPQLCDSRGRWTADYVRVRFAASVA
jgi:SAM-dependent methyltransferase